MKKITTLSLLLAFFAISNATTRTVSNDPAGGSQYSTLNAAHDASSDGDTLLLEGTDVEYSQGLRWTRSLVVIGIGFNPQKQNPRHSKIGVSIGAGSAFYIGNGSSNLSGCSFYGIEFTSQVVPLNPATNLTFEDCLFDRQLYLSASAGTYPINNVTITNCIFNMTNDASGNSANLSYSGSNVFISNCVFDFRIQGFAVGVNPVTIDHCLFLSSSYSPIYDVQNAQITNCIFMNNSTIEAFDYPGGYVGINNNYTNCLSRLGGLPAGNGNINSPSSPALSFVNCPPNTFSRATGDYHLSGGSAGIGTATDGTDIGVHGGTSNFSEKGEVLITPIIESLTVNNTTVQPNGTLNVTIHARKPKDN